MSFTSEELASHNKPDDLYVMIEGDVYDVTKFQYQHPGGHKLLQRNAGKDVSKEFWKFHNQAILRQYDNLKVGKVKNEQDAPFKDQIPASKEKYEEAVPEKEEIFGDLLPYGDPSWYQGYHSPYYNETHHAFRREVRTFMEKEILPFVEEWESEGKTPMDLHKKLGDKGYLIASCPHDFSEDLCDYKIKSVPKEKFDVMHAYIFGDELARCGSGGLSWFVAGGLSIGLPPVIHHMKNKKLRREVARSVLNGDKRICLAITEPEAGSDVANITTTAKKTEDGKFYIVNGQKKWITNGVFCDYFTVAVRTGKEGMNGVSLLLLEKSMEGVELRRMKCTGGYLSGTTFIDMSDVKVPVENIIGKENQGFKAIMSNFNNERLSIACQANRFARVCYEEALKYAHKRKTFNKKLIDHDIIKYKLANMVRQIESTQAWIEFLYYQMKVMPRDEATLRLGGAIAGCKAQAGITFAFCSSESIQVFGGQGYTRGGQGSVVERLWRDVKAYTIPGGSEEIMLLLSIKQGLRVAKFMGAKL